MRGLYAMPAKDARSRRCPPRHRVSAHVLRREFRKRSAHAASPPARQRLAGATARLYSYW
jgi:hypothetical protein